MEMTRSIWWFRELFASRSASLEQSSALVSHTIALISHLALIFIDQLNQAIKRIVFRQQTHVGSRVGFHALRWWQNDNCMLSTINAFQGIAMAHRKASKSISIIAFVNTCKDPSSGYDRRSVIHVQAITRAICSTEP